MNDFVFNMNKIGAVAAGVSVVFCACFCATLMCVCCCDGMEPEATPPCGESTGGECTSCMATVGDYDSDSNAFRIPRYATPIGSSFASLGASMPFSPGLSGATAAAEPHSAGEATLQWVRVTVLLV